MSPNMPEQGAAISALRHLFKTAGYQMDLRFAPVPRVQIAELEDRNVDGYFPSFSDETFEQKMRLSKLFYRTPWVIVERKDNPIVWKTPKDLLKYKGGNVAGYIIRSQVADAYKDKPDKLESAANDLANILKLAHKRVDFIFIDETTFKYISTTNPDVIPYANKLQVNKKVIVVNQYGVAFKDDYKRKKMLADFNKVANEKDFTASVNNYIEDRAKDQKLAPVNLHPK